MDRIDSMDAKEKDAALRELIARRPRACRAASTAGIYS